MLAYYKNVFWSKLMHSKKKKKKKKEKKILNTHPIFMHTSSAFPHQTHFQTISNGMSTAFFKYAGTRLSTT